MKKIEGVESANATLNQGLVTVRLKPGNTVRMEQIRKSIISQGFTPKEATVTAVGELIQSGGKTEFKILGSQDTYVVMDTPDAPWKDRTGKVSAKAQIPLPDKGRPAIQILSLEASENK